MGYLSASCLNNLLLHPIPPTLGPNCAMRLSCIFPFWKPSIGTSAWGSGLSNLSPSVVSGSFQASGPVFIMLQRRKQLHYFHLSLPQSCPSRPSLTTLCYNSVAKMYRLFVTPWTAGTPVSPPPSFTISEFAQTHVHWVGDAIQPSHPLTPFSCLQSFPALGSFPINHTSPH